MKEIAIESLKLNPMDLFGKNWALLAAGNERNGYNAMTIAWGQIGAVWDRKTSHGKIIIPVVSVFVRPQRYTKQFIDKEEHFTISAFPEESKGKLGYMGSHSGKEENKISNAGLTPFLIDDTISFREAKLTIVCKKIYHNLIKESGFNSQDIAVENYPEKDFHVMYMGEITKVFVNSDIV
jgi:hypothetical protein